MKLEDMNSEQIGLLTQSLMKRQLQLSLRVASIFIVLLIGIPLINLFAPDFGKVPIVGFPASWLFLAVLFYPITWVLSQWFVRGSEKLEEQIVQEVQSQKSPSGEVHI